jgi:hypothetical protein
MKKGLVGVFLALFFLAVGWVWGVSTLRIHIFPFDLVKELRSKYFFKEEKFDKEFVESKLGLISEQVSKIKHDLEKNGVEVRLKLVERILLPTEFVELSRQEKSLSEDIINASFYGIQVRGVLAHAGGHKKKCIVIYNQGHKGNPFEFKYHNLLRKRTLIHGCDFLSLSMLGIGQNLGGVSFPTKLGFNQSSYVKLTKYQAQNHNNYSTFYDDRIPKVEPLSLFLSGHYRIILDVIEKYSSVYMVGISGGGVYTSLLSALIPKIDKSISVAGSFPFFFELTGTGAPADYETRFAPLWNDYDFWHFYFLGLSDFDGAYTRSVYLIFNNEDHCCFFDPVASYVKRILDDAGHVKTIVDKSKEHSINVDLVFRILFEGF